MKSLFPDIVSTALPESRDFYSDLFGFRVVFEIDWYIQLEHPEDPNVQIAFVHRDNDAVPAPLRQAPQGFFVTIETDDVDELYEKARNAGHEIMVELTDEEWGQRRFVTVDPNGLPVDVFRLIKPSAKFAVGHGLP